MITVNDESKLIRLFYCVPILILLTTPQTLWACLPHSPNDVFIARMQALSPVSDVNQPINFDVQFSNHHFVFRPFWVWSKYSKPKQWRSNFKLKNIEKNELVIGLAYNPNGSKPTDYTISSLATLRCENDILIIGKPVVSFVAWNQENDCCFSLFR